MKRANTATNTPKKTRRPTSPLRAEYDFRGGIRGKYAERSSNWPDLVVLDPGIASQFRSEAEINRVLRDYLSKRLK